MNNKEKIIKRVLAICSYLTIVITIGIVGILLVEAVSFFNKVSIIDFFTDTRWSPLFTNKHFGIMPLLSGTIIVTVVAITIALPIGISIAIYLSEYASQKFKVRVKPLLELLAAVPTVVYGFFALTVVTPFLQSIFPQISGFSALSAGIVMGIMIIPYISSMSEDAMSAVPNSLRDASYGMGALRFQTAFKVIVPAASSAIIASIILAISRAVGETMIVTIAAGMQPNLTANIMKPVETITAYIVQVSSGDVPYGSVEYQTIYAAGITLFAFTFILNTISFRIKKKYRQVYE